MEYHKVGHLLERTSRKVKLSFVQLFKELNVDITPEQWMIIDTLNSNDGLTQSELAEEGFKNAPTISRIIDGLEKKQLVQRVTDRKDKRKSFIYITEEGKSIVNRCLPGVNKLREHTWKGLDGDDYHMFREILDKVFSNLD